MDKLKAIFSDPNHVIETSIEYEYEPLEVEPKEYDADIVRRNIRRVWESLKVLTPVQAEMEKIWVALAIQIILIIRLEFLIVKLLILIIKSVKNQV